MASRAQLRDFSVRPFWREGWPFRVSRSRQLLVRGKLIFAAVAWTLAGFWTHEAHAQSSKEYDLKAVLLFHLTQFVEWPPTSFPSADAPLVIGILGHDPFGQVLDDVVKHETRDHRGIVVERYRSASAIGNCQVLFIDGSESRHLPRVLAALRGRPVLTVGDFDDFAQRGGMIRFIKTPDDKITIHVNLDAAKSCGLNISAKLLRVAEVISQPNR